MLVSRDPLPCSITPIDTCGVSFRRIDLTSTTPACPSMLCWHHSDDNCCAVQHAGPYNSRRLQPLHALVLRPTGMQLQPHRLLPALACLMRTDRMYFAML